MMKLDFHAPRILCCVNSSQYSKILDGSESICNPFIAMYACPLWYYAVLFSPSMSQTIKVPCGSGGRPHAFFLLLLINATSLKYEYTKLVLRPAYRTNGIMYSTAVHKHHSCQVRRSVFFPFMATHRQAVYIPSIMGAAANQPKRQKYAQ